METEIDAFKWIAITIMITTIFFGGEERDLADSVIGLIDRSNAECIVEEGE